MPIDHTYHFNKETCYLGSKLKPTNFPFWLKRMVVPQTALWPGEDSRVFLKEKEKDLRDQSSNHTIFKTIINTLVNNIKAAIFLMISQHRTSLFHLHCIGPWLILKLLQNSFKSGEKSTCPYTAFVRFQYYPVIFTNLFIPIGGKGPIWIQNEQKINTDRTWQKQEKARIRMLLLEMTCN